MGKFQVGEKVVICDAAKINDPSLIIDIRMTGYRSLATKHAGQTAVVTIVGIYTYSCVSVGGDDFWCDDTWLTLVVPVSQLAQVQPAPTTAPVPAITYKLWDKVVVCDKNTIDSQATLTVMADASYRKSASNYCGKSGVITEIAASPKLYAVRLDIAGPDWFDILWVKPVTQVTGQVQTNVVGPVVRHEPVAIRFREFAGFCDACGGQETHKRGCPPKSPFRKGNERMRTEQARYF